MPLWTVSNVVPSFPTRAVPPVGVSGLRRRAAYVNWKGQTWLHSEELAKRPTSWCGATNLGIPGIGLEPGFAIGQRALLVPEADGCVMWDCRTLGDPGGGGHMFRSLGGLKGDAVSHRITMARRRLERGVRAACRSICTATIASSSRGRIRPSCRGP